MVTVPKSMLTLQGKGATPTLLLARCAGAHSLASQHPREAATSSERPAAFQQRVETSAIGFLRMILKAIAHDYSLSD